MAKFGWIVAAVVGGGAVLGAGAYLGVQVLDARATARVEAALDKARASLPPGAVLEVGSVSAGAFSDAATLRDVSFSRDGTTLSVQSLEISGVRPAAEAKASRIDEMRGKGVSLTVAGPGPTHWTATSFTVDGLSGPAPVAGSVDPKKIDFDKLRLSGVAFDGPGPHGSIDSIAADGLSADALARVALDGVLVDAQQGSLHLGHLEIREIPRNLKDAGSRGQPPFQDFEAAAAMFAPTRPGTGSISLDSVTVHQTSGGAAVSGQSRFSGLVLAFAPGPMALQAHQVLGADRLTLSGDSSWSNDRRTHVATSKVHFAAQGLGEFTIDGAMEGIPAVAPATMDAWRAEAGDLRLRSASLSYVDASLVRRLLAMAAERRGMSTAQFADMLSLAARQRLLALGPRGLEAAVAVSQFLHDPHVITFSLAPSRPVAPGEISAADPVGAADLLNFTVTAR